MIRDGNMHEVRRIIEQLGAEIKQLVRSAIELSYFSRGAWSYETVLRMSAGEREIALEFINARLEAAKKTQTGMTFI
jgi:16S rRNA U516 pseudouridylate synthase RsuA-like enzyme